MFIVGWLARRQVSQDRQDPRERTEVSVRKSHAMQGGRVVSDLLQWSKTIEQADNDKLSSMASRLLASAHAQSMGHWAPLLARWSVSDGRGMISFIEKQAPPSIREYAGDAGQLAILKVWAKTDLQGAWSYFFPEGKKSHRESTG